MDIAINNMIRILQNSLGLIGENDLCFRAAGTNQVPVVCNIVNTGKFVAVDTEKFSVFFQSQNIAVGIDPCFIDLIQADQFVTDFEKKYVSLYGGASTFFPAVCFDRMKFLGMQDPGPAYFVESNVAFEAMLGNVNLIPSFAELNVRPKHNEADNTITVKVNLNTQANVMPGQTDLRLTTWLVEDGIVSTEQKGVSGEYIQDGVIRAVLSEDVWGDKVDISSYSASKEYSIAVDPKWNLANMRVVSFLSNYDPSNKVYQLYNSRESKVQVSSGISSVVRTPDSMVTVTDGNVEAINGNTLVGVHDLSGRSFTGKNLPKGMYIVTVSDGKQQSAVKVVVK